MKKILTLAILIFFSALTFSQSLSLINVGTAPDNNSGDPARTAFIKTNAVITQVNRIGILNITATGAEISLLHGVTTTSAQFNMLNTLRSDVQVQLDAKVSNATHTGDVTGSGALTLATVNSNPGTYTNTNLTVNAKGLVTAASNGSGSAGSFNNTQMTGLTDLQSMRVGGSAASIISNITVDSAGLIFEVNSSPIQTYIPPENRQSISKYPYIAHVIPSSGDTSNYPIPERGGIIYIDSTGGNSYLSLKQGRNNWQKIPLSHPTITPKTSSYSLQVADDGTIITMNTSGSTNLTIPLNSSQPIPIGSFIEIHNIGSGTMTFVVTGGVTAYYAALHLAQNASAVLRKLGTDMWMIDGNLN